MPDSMPITELDTARHTAEAERVSPDAGPSILSRSTTVALWRVLNALRDGWFLEDRLRNVARMIVADARPHGLRAEELLIALKREWPRLVECRRAPNEVQLRMLAERLVTFCIHEFYAGPRAANGGCAVQRCSAA